MAVKLARRENADRTVTLTTNGQIGDDQRDALTNPRGYHLEGENPISVDIVAGEGPDARDRIVLTFANPVANRRFYETAF